MKGLENLIDLEFMSCTKYNWPHQYYVDSSSRHCRKICYFHREIAANFAIFTEKQPRYLNSSPRNYREISHFALSRNLAKKNRDKFLPLLTRHSLVLKSLKLEILSSSLIFEFKLLTICTNVILLPVFPSQLTKHIIVSSFHWRPK